MGGVPGDTKGLWEPTGPVVRRGGGRGGGASSARRLYRRGAGRGGTGLE